MRNTHPKHTSTALHPANAQMVLATDLDGTFLGGSDTARRALYDWIEERAQEVALIFVTGRDPDAVAEFCGKRGVPQPSYVIGDVGTTIAQYQDGRVHPIPEMEAEIATLWAGRADEVRAMLARVSGLREQDTDFRYRLSYHYDTAVFDRATLAPVRDLGCDVLVSHGRFVDILPRGVSKGPSLLRLIEYLGMNPERVLVAGDTLNDLSMFETGLRGAVVGGAEPELLDAVAGLPRAHRCTGIGAAGIIEAIHVHNLHPAPPELLP